jgi:F-type H+-transporting ATPase subunit gamma
MAKARAIVKRRKAVRNIRKITKTMQMIATAKFQKALKRAVGTKPYTRKVRELVAELAASLGDNVEHPLLRRASAQGTAASAGGSNRIAVLVIASDRGLAGAYNGSVLRAATAFLRRQEADGKQIDLYVSGKKGVAYFNFQRRPITRRFDEFADQPKFADVDRVAEDLMRQFIDGKIDAVHVVYMNFVSASTQKAQALQLLPLSSLDSAAAPAAPGTTAGPAKAQTVYEFSPDPLSLLDELLPLTVKSALFQAFLDATTSENVARMIAMKSATDNADKMVKSLTMQYNRARQSQITTELSEIMGGVEAMEA